MTWLYDEKSLTVSVKGYGMINDATGFNQYVNKTKKLDILKGVTKIDKNVFVDCGTIEEVVLPNGLTEIDDYAFFFCDSLNDIEFGSKLQSIGNYAFYGTKLRKSEIPYGTQK